MELFSDMPNLLVSLLRHPVLLVGLGSGCGGVLRYYVGRGVDSYTGGPFPWGTFTVNAIGSFVLGVIIFGVFLRLHENYRWVYLLLGTGLCGGFTTFSTFSYETIRLLRDGMWWNGVVYVVCSVLTGLTGVLLGAGLVRLFVRG